MKGRGGASGGAKGGKGGKKAASSSKAVETSKAAEENEVENIIADIVDEPASSAPNTSSWDVVEINVLRSAVASMTQRDWDKVAEFLPRRTAAECKKFWEESMQQKPKGKGSWSDEEDQLLLTLVKEHGARNWTNLIAPYLPGRTGKQCRERFRNFVDPSRKRTAWTPEEERKAAELHAKYGNKWATIARELPGRSDNDVKNHFYASQRRKRPRDPNAASAAGDDSVRQKRPKKTTPPSSSSSSSSASNSAPQPPALKQSAEKEEDPGWELEEDTKLKELVEKFPKQWDEIATSLPGRSATDCKQRHEFLLNPSIVKGRGSWTEAEDKRLAELVNLYGPKKWSTAIAPHLPGRLGKQCRERWHNKLNPQLRGGKWTDEETELLFKLHKQHGNKWTTISKELPGRSDNDVKNRYYSQVRRKKNASPPLDVAAVITTPATGKTNARELLERAISEKD